MYGYENGLREVRKIWGKMASDNKLSDFIVS
jgi:hypothetical protein